MKKSQRDSMAGIYEKAVKIARAALEINRLDYTGYAFSCPAKGAYPWQWFWDSCFHSIIKSYYDLEGAKSELRSLIKYQQADGMIPHMIYDRPEAAHQRWGVESVTSPFTQPPLLAYATMRIYEKDRDENFLREMYNALLKYDNWFVACRDPDGDGLVYIIHPDESGWDNSPRWDWMVGADREEGVKKLEKRLIENGWKGPGLNAVPVDFNCLLYQQRRLIARMAAMLGEKDVERRYDKMADQMQKSILEKMWDADQCFFFDLNGAGELVRVKTAAAFVSLFAHICDKKHKNGLLQHLRSESEFMSPWPLPTVAMDEPTFDPNNYWRGSVWVNINWFVVRGLLNYGEVDLAKEIAHKTVRLVLRYDVLRECFNPLNGSPIGASNFGWSGLIVDLAEVIED